MSLADITRGTHLSLLQRRRSVCLRALTVVHTFQAYIDSECISGYANVVLCCICPYLDSKTAGTIAASIVHSSLTSVTLCTTIFLDSLNNWTLSIRNRHDTGIIYFDFA